MDLKLPYDSLRAAFFAQEPLDCYRMMVLVSRRILLTSLNDNTWKNLYEQWSIQCSYKPSLNIPFPNKNSKERYLGEDVGALNFAHYKMCKLIIFKQLEDLVMPLYPSRMTRNKKSDHVQQGSIDIQKDPFNSLIISIERLSKTAIVSEYKSILLSIENYRGPEEEAKSALFDMYKDAERTEELERNLTIAWISIISNSTITCERCRKGYIEYTVPKGRIEGLQINLDTCIDCVYETYLACSRFEVECFTCGRLCFKTCPRNEEGVPKSIRIKWKNTESGQFSIACFCSKACFYHYRIFLFSKNVFSDLPK